MKGAKITLPNQRRFALVPRSGSYAIIWQAIPETHRNPEKEGWHPINATTDTIGSPLSESENPEGLCCMVRDPVERFRSACARKNVSVEEGLSLINKDVHFWTLEFMGLIQYNIKYFLFPNQINDCAEWLGLRVPVPILNEEPIKPIVTEAEKDLIKFNYSSDIILWNELKH